MRHKLNCEFPAGRKWVFGARRRRRQSVSRIPARSAWELRRRRFGRRPRRHARNPGVAELPLQAHRLTTDFQIACPRKRQLRDRAGLTLKWSGQRSTLRRRPTSSNFRNACPGGETFGNRATFVWSRPPPMAPPCTRSIPMPTDVGGFGPSPRRGSWHARPKSARGSNLAGAVPAMLLHG